MAAVANRANGVVNYQNNGILEKHVVSIRQRYLDLIMTCPITEIADAFTDMVEPASFPMNITRFRNQRWAEQISIGDVDETRWKKHFGEFNPLADNLPSPLAMRYHGHQFGVYNPELGDGRGFLYAQLQDSRGKWFDLGTKGSGQTPWSRTADGRLTLKGGVREVLAAAYLEAMGVKTSKAFSLIETGEQLYRNDEPSPARSSVLVRLSETHIRFGTFQRCSYLDDADGMARLVDHSIRYYHSDTEGNSTSDRTVELFKRIIEATARMIAQWMAAGFVHGVMNTDNFNITGETFDFGPYRFLPHSDPNFVAAYFDHQGLYRFGRQPNQGLWALQQLGGAMTLLADKTSLSKALSLYEPAYHRAFARHTLSLLGLKDGMSLSADLKFLQQFYTWMTQSKAPWSQVFFDWFCGRESVSRALVSPISYLYETAEFVPIKDSLIAHEPDRPERLQHKYFEERSPATLLIDDVEGIWKKIAEEDDWHLFESKLKAFDEIIDTIGY